MNESIVEAIRDLLEEKGIDRDALVEIVESAFITVLKKQYEQEDAFSVTFNTERGDIEIFHIREVVPDGEVENEYLQIDLSHARSVEEDLEVGDDFVELVDYRKFGRRAILNLKNAILQKTREIEKENIFSEYHNRIGDILYADIYQINHKTGDVILNFDKVSFRMPAEERVPSESYHRKKRIRVMIKDVERRNKNEPEIIVSRADKNFIVRLFELEVSEISEGIIKVRGIVRVPGWRSKIMVESTDPRIHAVASCVGVKGARIQAIVQELRREKIDIVEYTTDKMALVREAMVPTKPVNVETTWDGRVVAIMDDKGMAKIRQNIEEEEKRGIPTPDLPPNESIYPKDINVRLVEQLAETEIMLVSEARHIADKLLEQEQELILDEIDEITEEQLNVLKEAGYYYAEAVLDELLEDLVSKTGLKSDEATAIKQAIGSYFQEAKVQDVLELPQETRDRFIEAGYEFVDDVMDADQKEVQTRTGLTTEEIADVFQALNRYSEDEPVEPETAGTIDSDSDDEAESVEADPEESGDPVSGPSAEAVEAEVDDTELPTASADVDTVDDAEQDNDDEEAPKE